MPVCANCADFLTATLDKGGLTGMLALNGIFELVRSHEVAVSVVEVGGASDVRSDGLAGMLALNGASQLVNT